MKKIIIGVASILTIGAGFVFISGIDDLDRFSPFTKEKDVYVLSKGLGVPSPEHNGKKYTYELNGVDQSGEEEKINILTDTKDSLGEEKYFKVHVKGRYVFQYDHIKEKDVPEKAKEKLRK